MSAATVQASLSQKTSMGSAPTSTRPTRQTGNGRKPAFKSEIHRHPGKKSINPLSNQMVNPSSPPPQRLPPHPNQFDRKNLKIADYLSPKKSGTGRRPLSQARRRTWTFQTFQTFEETQAKPKNDAGGAYNKKVRQNDARGCVQRKNFIKSRPRSAPSQKSRRGRGMSVFYQPKSPSRPDRPEMRRKPRGMEVGQTW
jgi:hypothetical protein